MSQEDTLRKELVARTEISEVQILNLFRKS